MKRKTRKSPLNNTENNSDKRLENLKPWGKGQSGNPKGRPVGTKGKSWKTLFDEFGELTPKEAAEQCRAIARELSKINSPITLKAATVLRIYTALLFEPDARLLNIVLDRVEGKVPQKLEILDWRAELEKRGINAGEVFARLVESIAAVRARPDDGRGDSGSGQADGGAGAAGGATGDVAG